MMNIATNASVAATSASTSTSVPSTFVPSTPSILRHHVQDSPSNSAHSPSHSIVSSDTRYFSPSSTSSDSDSHSPVVIASNYPYRLSFVDPSDLSDEFHLHDSTEVIDKSNLERPKPAARITTRPAFTRSITIATDTASMASETTSTLDPIPGSPPELSSSKSSMKTTSLQSSPSSDDLSDTTHFEEISLTDNTPIIQTTPSRPFTLRPRPMLRTAQTMLPPSTPNKINRSPNTDLRATATLNNHAQKHSPRMGSGWQRPFPSAPSSPISNTTLTTPRRLGARTPSPTKSSGMPSSPILSSPNRTPRPTFESSPILPLSRRSSYQPASNPNRKTQKELELEYHDSDDDLPDDIMMWNVPLSPRPMTNRSPSVSPERGSLQPRSGEGRGGLRFSRTKTWAAALQELSEDAQKLTVKLEQHFDEQAKKDPAAHAQSPSSPTSSNGSSPRPGLHHRANTVAGLPMLTKAAAGTSPLLENALPVSKEKERYLSRTRPSWLPPKCPKEEAKHWREYERMMAQLAGQKV